MQTVTGISRPPCTRRDRRYLESTTVTVMFPPLEIKKRLYLEISLGKCPTVVPVCLERLKFRFCLENKMMSTKLSRNFMPFFHFPLSKSRKKSLAKCRLANIAAKLSANKVV